MSDNEVEANQRSVATLAVRLHRIADQLARAPSGALRVVSVSDECAQSGQHGLPLFILQGQQPARRVAVAGLAASMGASAAGPETSAPTSVIASRRSPINARGDPGSA